MSRLSLLHLALCSLLSAAALPRSGAAQADGQSFTVEPEIRRATVGDTVPLRFRVRLNERDLLLDTVPTPTAPQDGVRILAVEKLQPAGPSRVLQGGALLAFYRTGPQEIPRFGLPFMRIVSGVRGTIVSDSAGVEIVPVLPAGNPSMRDIRELPLSRGLGAWWLAIPAALLLALTLGWLLRRRHAGARPGPVAEPPLQPIPAPGPYEIALRRLAAVERERWPARGLIVEHYEAVVDTLRDYLEDAERVPARERTTPELTWALPPHLGAEGRRDRCRELWTQADLVKFAGARPDGGEAGGFLQSARGLLEGWHGVANSREPADAVR